MLQPCTFPENVQLIKQGAEARVYTGDFLGRPTIIKERFSKSYRHPLLDKALTLKRMRAEVKCIQRCRANGIRCPAIYFVDVESNRIFMEYIANCVTVKDYIIKQQQQKSVDVAKPHNVDCGRTSSADSVDVTGDNSMMTVGGTTNGPSSALFLLAKEIGRIIGTMHRNHIIHGDLTTSNLLLPVVESGNDSDLCIVVIDFGLASIDESAEDKGVDLYVLERALLSTHPSTEPLFEAILSSYREAYAVSGKHGSKNGGGGAAAADEVLRKLNEIRLRGRKRTMVG
jgi:TP53 regulating kinase-like protein